MEPQAFLEHQVQRENEGPVETKDSEDKLVKQAMLENLDYKERKVGLEMLEYQELKVIRESKE
jgi:hypothetical protein